MEPANERRTWQMEITKGRSRRVTTTPFLGIVSASKKRKTEDLMSQASGEQQQERLPP